MKKLTQEEWIKKAKLKHEDKFDYSKVKYVNSKTPVIIICPIHGEFEQVAGSHLQYGCAKCAGNKHITLEEFIERSSKIHNNKFDYSKVHKFSKVSEKVTIICPIHGEFSQIVGDHMKGIGCNKCRCSKSKELNPIENKSKTREYSIWKGMKNRVLNPNCGDYERYGERGIECCQEWVESFEAFYKDMGDCPKGYSIDRIDNNKGYYKENCRWANSGTQASNRGDFNKIFEYNGKAHVLKEWSRILDIKYSTLYSRIYRAGLTFEEAIQKDPFKKLINIDGKEHILKEWCQIYNIKYQTVVNRINKHKWDPIRAITTPGKPFWKLRYSLDLLETIRNVLNAYHI